MIDVQLYIDGQWTDGSEGRRFSVDNPATGELMGRAIDASAADVDAAISAAERASKGWASTFVAQRAEILTKIYEDLMAHQDELARLLTEEEGKSLKEARSEVAYGARFFRFYASDVWRIEGDTLPQPGPDRAVWTTKVPIGVTVLITPWNYPLAMICRKMAPALAAGCPVIVKPAEQTPLVAARLFEVLAAAGLPAGVVNLVTGDPNRIGPLLLEDARVRKISFTGSTAVGQVILRHAASHIASVSLELGGNAPFIVFDDVDLDQVVEAILSCKFRNAGQICVAANRIYVQRNILSALGERLGQAVTQLRVGDGLEADTVIGPLINQEAVEKVTSHVQNAVGAGARVVVGGQTLQRPGYFYAPTVLTDVHESMQLALEETFGPVAPLFAFDSEEEVFERANRTKFGLAAYVFTRDLGRAMRAAAALEFGMVGINDPVPSLAEVPIGGMKESGLGREGGHEGLAEFLETKYVSVRW
ncbi:MAG: succinate-semialdehyde dehydrogenase (NADP(+)) [Sulfobacillus acidophilus]|uniref:Succinate-semialdehyde dehydrogenase (NADP(+)) n=1 Tax=Sulfobacillus acidophilus TaxID=53633 RepID=A0A2T2WJR2_9FIRM|nr:MAG: succinate-semialdehyde dehydrogenase (NADP(+)) [Sulfobacillus acidophilus]